MAHVPTAPRPKPTVRIAPDTGIDALMAELLGGTSAEARIDAALDAAEFRADTLAAVQRLTDGALEVTGDAFPPDYTGIDDLTLARTYEVV